MRKHWFFPEQRDGLGKLGICSDAKVMIAIQQLVYGETGHSLCQYYQMGRESADLCLLYFCEAIRGSYEENYIRPPKSEEAERIAAIHEKKHGFPGMLGSIDCMHWK